MENTLAVQKQAVSDFNSLHDELIKPKNDRGIQQMLDVLTDMPERAQALLMFVMATLDVACLTSPDVARTLDKMLRAYK
jgi:hypothetical protein